MPFSYTPPAHLRNGFVLPAQTFCSICQFTASAWFLTPRTPAVRLPAWFSQLRTCSAYTCYRLLWRFWFAACWFFCFRPLLPIPYTLTYICAHFLWVAHCRQDRTPPPLGSRITTLRARTTTAGSPRFYACLCYCLDCTPPHRRHLPADSFTAACVHRAAV